MKKIVLLIVMFSTLAFSGKVFFDDTSVVIAPESQLLIKGTTNVNNFKCVFDTNKFNKPIPIYYKVVHDKMIFDKAKLTLDNTCFDCGSRGINKDFRKLLKSNEYPEIELFLKEINRDNLKVSTVMALLELHIAGKSKSYYLPLSIDSNEDIFVSGVLKLNITDFDLVAPKKALGLIVVSDDIEINFKLNFKECKL